MDFHKIILLLALCSSVFGALEFFNNPVCSNPNSGGLPAQSCLVGDSTWEFLGFHGNLPCASPEDCLNTQTLYTQQCTPTAPPPTGNNLCGSLGTAYAAVFSTDVIYGQSGCSLNFTISAYERTTDFGGCDPARTQCDYASCSTSSSCTGFTPVTIEATVTDMTWQRQLTPISNPNLAKPHFAYTQLYRLNPFKDFVTGGSSPLSPCACNFGYYLNEYIQSTTDPTACSVCHCALPTAYWSLPLMSTAECDDYGTDNEFHYDTHAHCRYLEDDPTHHPTATIATELTLQKLPAQYQHSFYKKAPDVFSIQSPFYALRYSPLSWDSITAQDFFLGTNRFVPPADYSTAVGGLCPTKPFSGNLPDQKCPVYIPDNGFPATSFSLSYYNTLMLSNMNALMDLNEYYQSYITAINLSEYHITPYGQFQPIFTPTDYSTTVLKCGYANSVRTLQSGTEKCGFNPQSSQSLYKGTGCMYTRHADSTEDADTSNDVDFYTDSTYTTREGKNKDKSCQVPTFGIETWVAATDVLCSMFTVNENTQNNGPTMEVAVKITYPSSGSTQTVSYATSIQPGSSCGQFIDPSNAIYLQIDSDQTSPSDTISDPMAQDTYYLGACLLTEDWEEKYPNDPWIDQTNFADNSLDPKKGCPCCMPDQYKADSSNKRLWWMMDQNTFNKYASTTGTCNKLGFDPESTYGMTDDEDSKTNSGDTTQNNICQFSDNNRFKACVPDVDPASIAMMYEGYRKLVSQATDGQTALNDRCPLIPEPLTNFLWSQYSPEAPNIWLDPNNTRIFYRATDFSASKASTKVYLSLAFSDNIGTFFVPSPLTIQNTDACLCDVLVPVSSIKWNVVVTLQAGGTPGGTYVFSTPIVSGIIESDTQCVVYNMGSSPGTQASFTLTSTQTLILQCNTLTGVFNCDTVVSLRYSQNGIDQEPLIVQSCNDALLNGGSFQSDSACNTLTSCVYTPPAFTPIPTPTPNTYYDVPQPTITPIPILTPTSTPTPTMVPKKFVGSTNFWIMIGITGGLIIVCVLICVFVFCCGNRGKK